jgi:DNA topoisomerase I
VMAGRYGPYVSDGTTHATLPRGKDPKEVRLDEAVRLIDEKAAKGPSKKAGRKRARRKSA